MRKLYQLEHQNEQNAVRFEIVTSDTDSYFRDK